MLDLYIYLQQLTTLRRTYDSCSASFFSVIKTLTTAKIRVETGNGTELGVMVTDEVEKCAQTVTYLLAAIHINLKVNANFPGFFVIKKPV